MPNILELVDPVVATLTARQVPEPIENPLTSVLPNVRVQGRKSKTVRRTHRTTTAKFRSYDAEAPIGKRPDSIVLQELALPALSEKLPISEDLLLQLAESGGATPVIDRIVESIYDDVERLTTSVLNRAELARGQFLSTGKVTINENGFVDEADFGLAATHKVTPAVLWSNPAATAIDDELVWQRQVRRDAGRPVQRAVTSERVRNFLLRNEQYRTAFWQGVANPPTLNPEQLNQVRATYGLPPIEVYEGEVNVDDVITRVIDDHLFVYVTDNVGESQWGITAEARQLVASNAVDFAQEQAPGLMVVQWSDPDPVVTWTKVASIFLPVAGDINGLLVASVVAPS
ncbi:major capsid protein [Cellulomonas taurus]|uniref:major capsid protein n=1 Tax=Cellulomonas taurus TaxID=2729175 RepID=UPI00145D9758|nr:major capsid protein [Cellulomonas taurus]